MEKRTRRFSLISWRRAFAISVLTHSLLMLSGERISSSVRAGESRCQSALAVTCPQISLKLTTTDAEMLCWPAAVAASLRESLLTLSYE